MKNSKRLLLASAALLLALTGASYAHDGAEQGAKGGQHQCQQAPQFTTAQRELLKETMMQTHKENKPLYEKLHQLHKDMRALLKADSFDQQAFLAKSDEAVKLKAEIATNKDKAFVGVAPQFSPEERKFLWKMTMRHHRHHGHHHGMWGHKDGKWGHDKMDDKMKDGQQPAAPADVAPQQDAQPAQ